MSKPSITLYFLQASRSIRTAWLLEELGVPYNLEFADRQQQKAPPEFKEKCGNPLGKFPTLTDGELCLYESGAIAEYLCETYDKQNKMLPSYQPQRSKAQIWLHASEATFAIHALAILYARWSLPADVKESNPDALTQMEKGLSVNVRNDFGWLEKELGESSGPFLLGEKPTVADVMMEFSADFILERGLGVKKDEEGWPRVREWLERCHAEEGYKKAVEKTGHTLHPKTI